MKWNEDFATTPLKPKQFSQEFFVCVLGCSGWMLKDPRQLGHCVCDVPVTCSTQAPALEKQLYWCMYFPQGDLTVYTTSFTLPLQSFEMNFIPVWRASISCKHHLNPISPLFPELKCSWCGTLCKLSCVGVNFSIGSPDAVSLSHSSKEYRRH